MTNDINITVIEDSTKHDAESGRVKSRALTVTIPGFSSKRRATFERHDSHFLLRAYSKKDVNFGFTGVVMNQEEFDILDEIQWQLAKRTDVDILLRPE